MKPITCPACRQGHMVPWPESPDDAPYDPAALPGFICDHCGAGWSRANWFKHMVPAIPGLKVLEPNPWKPARLVEADEVCVYCNGSFQEEGERLKGRSCAWCLQELESEEEKQGIRKPT